MKKIIRKIIEHNPRHYLKIKIRGHWIYPCARCTGMYSSFFAVYFTQFFIRFDNVSLPLIYIISWVFVSPFLVDWLTVKLEFREGGNRWRVFTGILCGIGFGIYLFYLPVDKITRVLSLIIFMIFFSINSLIIKKYF